MAADGSHAPSSSLEKLGMELQDLTPDLAAKLKIHAEHGVVVTDVQPGSDAAEKAGLTGGMVIVEARPQSP